MKTVINKVIAALIFFALVTSAFATNVTTDAVGTSQQFSGPSNTLATASYTGLTVSAGNAILVAVACDCPATFGPATVVWGAQSLTLVATVSANSGGGNNVTITFWGGLAPTTGNQTALATFTTFHLPSAADVAAISFDSVKQTSVATAFIASAGTSSATGVTISDTISGVGSADMVASAFGTSFSTITISGTAPTSWFNDALTGGSNFAGAYTQAGHTSVTTTFSGAIEQAAAISVDIVAAVGASTSHNLLLLGVGQ